MVSYFVNSASVWWHAHTIHFALRKHYEITTELNRVWLLLCLSPVFKSQRNKNRAILSTPARLYLHVLIWWLNSSFEGNEGIFTIAVCLFAEGCVAWSGQQVCTAKRKQQVHLGTKSPTEISRVEAGWRGMDFKASLFISLTVPCTNLLMHCIIVAQGLFQYRLKNIVPIPMSSGFWIREK